MRVRFLSGNQKGKIKELPAREAESAIATGYAEKAPDLAPEIQAADEPPALREDGPTLEEWIEAGYLAEHYPPKGWAEKPSAGLDEFRKTGKAPLRVEDLELADQRTGEPKNPHAGDEAGAVLGGELVDLEGSEPVVPVAATAAAASSEQAPSSSTPPAAATKTTTKPTGKGGGKH